MSHFAFMDKLRSFLGIRQDVPPNEFRNPIWGDDDDDDGDELYSRDRMDVYDVRPLQEEFARQMQDMFQSFGSIFGDVKTFFHEFESHDSFTNTPPLAAPPEPDHFDSNRIREFYLKPGYHNHRQDKEDIDLDGKLSSNDIAGLLKQKQEEDHSQPAPFNGNLVPGRSFCRTIITTSVTKPDGSRETKRIVKNGHEVVEETITTSDPDPRGLSSAIDSFSNHGMIYSNIFSDLGSIFKSYY